MGNSNKQDTKIYKGNLVINIHANTPSSSTMNRFKEGLAEVLQNFNILAEGKRG